MDINLTIKFNVGDTVYAISSFIATENCAECKGYGVIAENNSLKTCLVCNGRKKNKVTRYQCQKITINYIEVKFDRDDIDIKYCITNDGNQCYNDDFWRDNELFATEEEAQQTINHK